MALIWDSPSGPLTVFSVTALLVVTSQYPSKGQERPLLSHDNGSEVIKDIFQPQFLLFCGFNI